MDKPRKVLYKLAKSKKMPERRTAIVSTLYFIGKGDVEDAFKLAEMMLYDKEELIHKANGWALRFAGDKDRQQLIRFWINMPLPCRVRPCAILWNTLTKSNVIIIWL